jgi:hypothetical protein
LADAGQIVSLSHCIEHVSPDFLAHNGRHGVVYHDMSAFRWPSQAWFGYAAALVLTGVVTGIVAAVRAIADVGNA